MHVAHVMRTEFATVSPDTSLVKAREIMTEKPTEHLLVVDKDGKLVGIVSGRDVQQSCASLETILSADELNHLLKQLTVNKIMVKKIITISPSGTIERAVRIMQENRISAMPVTQKGKPVGIITNTDATEVLLEGIGIHRESSRLTVLVEDRIGMVADVARILKDQQINICSLITWPEKEHSGAFQLVMRVAAVDGEKAVSALTGAGFKVLTKYVEDLTLYLPKA
ncbi:MAG: CBS domain-containing protein [Desulfobacterales bacterium]|nr:CBS domain-containing protein [Desulfobacterales bacterium]